MASTGGGSRSPGPLFGTGNPAAMTLSASVNSSGVRTRRTEPEAEPEVGAIGAASRIMTGMRLTLTPGPSGPRAVPNESSTSSVRLVTGVASNSVTAAGTFGCRISSRVPREDTNRATPGANSSAGLMLAHMAAALLT